MNISEDKAVRTIAYFDKVRNKINKQAAFIDKRRKEFLKKESEADKNYVESTCPDCGEKCYTRFDAWKKMKKPITCPHCEYMENKIVTEKVSSYIKGMGYETTDICISGLRRRY